MSSSLKLVTARINIGLVINKLIVRQKHASTNEKQREGINVMLKDLDDALKIVLEISEENEKLHRIITKLHTEKLQLKQEILKLTTIEKNIEL